MLKIILFVFGVMFGSAANALIDRLPKRESWFTGQSHCDRCKHVLEWKDLIPIASYLTVRGKCRYCHSPIPVRNLWVEILMGAGFIAIFNQFSNYSIFNLFLILGIWWVTIIIAVMDWETKLVSEAMVVAWGGLIIANQVLISNDKFLNPNNIAGLLVGVGVIGGVWAISKGKAMGFGDVEIAAVLGWWLAWPNILVGLWTAFVTGAIVGSYELLTGRKKLKSEIAFGPFLIFGGWTAYFWGNYLWQLVVR